MSIVVGLKHHQRVYIASDSQITVGDYKKPLRSVKSLKIWHPNEMPNIVLGSVGLVRERNVLQASSDLINHQTCAQVWSFDVHHVVNHIIPEMFELFEKHKILPESKGMRKFNNQYLLAVDDQLFEIGYNGSVIEIDSFTAIGSGDVEAMAYLSGTTIEDPIETLAKAIQAAKMQNLYVDDPIKMTSTISTKVWEYKKEENSASSKSTETQ